MATNVAELKQLMLEVGMDKALVDAMDPAQSMVRQGMDSVDLPAFAVAMELRFARKFSDSELLQLKTLNDLVAFVNRS